MNIKRHILLLGIVLISSASIAQQDASTSQYTMNKIFINPAFAGYRDVATISFTHRSQWIGFEGAPVTEMISYDAPISKTKLSVGAGFMFDKIGPTSRYALSGDITYRLRLINKASLAFGAKVSMQLYQANLNSVLISSDYYNIQDDAFQNNQQAILLPNVGFGAMYFKKTFFLGFSCPNMIRPKIAKKGSLLYTSSRGRYEPTFYLTGAKHYKINKDLTVQPMFILKGTVNAPLSLGLYGNAIFLKDFTGGIFYFLGESGGLLFQWQVNKQLKVGYSVEIAANRLIRTNFGSHDLSAFFTLHTQKKRVIYPRHF